MGDNGIRSSGDLVYYKDYRDYKDHKNCKDCKDYEILRNFQAHS